MIYLVIRQINQDISLNKKDLFTPHFFQVFILTFENQRIKHESIKCRDRGLQRRKKIKEKIKKSKEKKDFFFEKISKSKDFFS
jgi:hypothetical protein